MFRQPDLFERAAEQGGVFDMPALIERITVVSKRPRYTFIILNLIAKAAGPGGSAGPYVRDADRRVPLRDWLADAMIPVAQRDARRQATLEAVRETLVGEGRLPSDPSAAKAVIDQELRRRVRQSGRCNVSRAVSDLVQAGLVQRHYQGYRVDHTNRGGQREAVYTITPAARQALGQRG